MTDAFAPVQLTANGMQFTGLQWGSGDGGGGRSGHNAPVLCLHGFPQRCTSWSGVAERLADAGLRCVAIDQRGYSPGARPVELEAYTLPNLVADAVAMIEFLGGQVHLVGHDWGGVVGWQVAARRPELVASWTAVSTANPLAIEEVLAADPGERERFGYIREFRRPGAEHELTRDDWAGLRALYGDRVPAARVSDDLAFLRQQGVLTAALNWYRAMSPSDSAGLGPVSVPTTYVWGSADMAFSRAAAQASGRHVIGRYRFVALEGAGHWLPDEAPAALAEAIAAQVLDG